MCKRNIDLEPNGPRTGSTSKCLISSVASVNLSNYFAGSIPSMQAGRWQQTRRRISAAHFQPSVLVTLRGIACREPWGESCIMLVLCHLLKLSHISIVRVEGHCSHQMDETNLDKHPLMPRKMHLFIPFPCFSYSLRIPLLRGNPIEPSAW